MKVSFKNFSKTSKKLEKNAQILKIPNSLLSAPHSMGVVVRKIYLQTLKNGECVKLTQLLKNKNQKRVKNYLTQLKKLTIKLSGKNIKVYRRVSYHRGNLNYQLTPKIKKELKRQAPYTLLNFTHYQTLRSKYAQALYELTDQFRVTGQLYMRLDTLKQRLACPDYQYPSRLKHRIIKPSLAKLAQFYTYSFRLTRNCFILNFKKKLIHNSTLNFFTIDSPRAVAI